MPLLQEGLSLTQQQIFLVPSMYTNQITSRS
ncbi:hypothetical protein SK37_03015 [Citrobacter sp. MGH109]|nr:hypothetical protein SK37_03015 [Citrobacter sp. MGH109]